MISSPEKNPRCNAAENSFSLYGSSRKGYARQIKIEEDCTIHQGPEEYAHRFEWVPFLWGRVLTPKMRDRLVRNLQRLQFSSHFSGMGGLEMLIFIMCYWVNKLCGPSAVDNTRSLHACDIADHCRKTLAAYHHAWRPHHIAKDIAERVPPDTLEKMKKELPKATDRKEAQRLKFDKIKNIANEYFENMVGLPIEAPCGLSGGRKVDLYTRRGEVLSSEDELHYGSRDALTLNGSGVVCKNVSRIGGRTGDTGSGALSQIIWQAERKAMNEDLIFVECTEDFEPEHIQYELRGTHSCTTALMKAYYTGDSYNRTRRSTMFDSCARVVVVEDVGHYLNMSTRSCEMSWEDSFLDDDFTELSELDCIARAKRRGRVLPVDTSELTFRDTLLPSQLDRAQLYMELFGPETMLVDVDHNPAKRARKLHPDIYSRNHIDASGSVKHMLPCLISHFTMLNNKLERPLLAYEALGVHGVPSSDVMQCEFKDSFPVDIMGLMANDIVSYNNVKSMVGNGWHLASQGTWLLLWLASIELRHTLDVFDHPFYEISSDSDCADDDLESPNETGPDIFRALLPEEHLALPVSPQRSPLKIRPSTSPDSIGDANSPWKPMEFNSAPLRAFKKLQNATAVFDICP